MESKNTFQEQLDKAIDQLANISPYNRIITLLNKGSKSHLIIGERSVVVNADLVSLTSPVLAAKFKNWTPAAHITDMDELGVLSEYGLLIFILYSYFGTTKKYLNEVYIVNTSNWKKIEAILMTFDMLGCDYGPFVSLLNNNGLPKNEWNNLKILTAYNNCGQKLPDHILIDVLLMSQDSVDTASNTSEIVVQLSKIKDAQLLATLFRIMFHKKQKIQLPDTLVKKDTKPVYWT
jgi:hypothetical protein